MNDWAQGLSRILGWSYHAFTVRGIRVRFHFFLLAWTALEVIRAVGKLVWHPAVLEGHPAANALAWRWFELDLCIVAFVWGSILLHEFGHCIAAFRVGGSADQILMWPLGGLASCQAPNTPLKQFIVAAGGPLVNVLIAAAGFAALGIMNTAGAEWVTTGADLGMAGVGDVVFEQYAWGMEWSWTFTPEFFESRIAWLIKVNLLLTFFNIIPAFPMDGGRMLLCILWPRLGYKRATRIAVRTAQVCAVGMVIVGFVIEQYLLAGIGIMVFFAAMQELQMVEMGARQDERLFGHDFSQGYTSLGETQSQSQDGGAKRPGFIARWRERRRRRRERREREVAIDRRKRVDDLLDKINAEGIHSLTPAERRFLEDASKDYGKDS